MRSDPACGTVEFLVAAYEWLMKQTKDGALDRDTARRVKKDVYFGQELMVLQYYILCVRRLA